jgi:hypothetical protein
MVKLRERKIRDSNQVKCIKDVVDKFLVKDYEIKNKWRKYFNKLFNEESKKIMTEFDDSFDDTSNRFIRRIQESEVKIL